MAILNSKSLENNPINAKKQQPTENQKNTKTEVKWGPVFTFNLSGWLFVPLSPISYVTGCEILYLHAVSYPYSTATRYELVA